MVNDQRGCPTWTHHLSEAVVSLIESGRYGLYHATNSGPTTWFDYAVGDLSAGGDGTEVRPITSDQFPTAAIRPKNSVLDPFPLPQAIGREMPPWQEALAQYLEQRRAKRRALSQRPEGLPGHVRIELMRLLVTGGAGFIGSNFVQYILQEYPAYEVVDLDALTYAGNPDNLREVLDNPRHRFVQGRIEDGELVDRLAPGIDVIVNFAAESHVDRSIVEPQVFIKTNVMGTQVLLDAALRHQVKLFYQVSTDEVYGALPLDTEGEVQRESQLRPNSPYSASKTAADLLVLAYHHT